MPEEPKKSVARQIYEKLTGLNRTFEQFQEDMRNPEARFELYNNLQRRGGGLPDYETFELDLLGYTDNTTFEEDIASFLQGEVKGDGLKKLPLYPASPFFYQSEVKGDGLKKQEQDDPYEIFRTVYLPDGKHILPDKSKPSEFINLATGLFDPEATKEFEEQKAKEKPKGYKELKSFQKYLDDIEYLNKKYSSDTAEYDADDERKLRNLINVRNTVVGIHTGLTFGELEDYKLFNAAKKIEELKGKSDFQKDLKNIPDHIYSGILGAINLTIGGEFDTSVKSEIRKEATNLGIESEFKQEVQPKTIFGKTVQGLTTTAVLAPLFAFGFKAGGVKQSAGYLKNLLPAAKGSAIVFAPGGLSKGVQETVDEVKEREARGEQLNVLDKIWIATKNVGGETFKNIMEGVSEVMIPGFSPGKTFLRNIFKKSTLGIITDTWTEQITDITGDLVDGTNTSLLVSFARTGKFTEEAINQFLVEAIISALYGTTVGGGEFWAGHLRNQLSPKEYELLKKYVEDNKDKLEENLSGILSKAQADIDKQVEDQLRFINDLNSEVVKVTSEIQKMNPDIFSGEILSEVSGNKLGGWEMWEALQNTPELQELQREVMEAANIQDPNEGLETTMQILMGRSSLGGVYTLKNLDKARQKYQDILMNIANWRLIDKDLKSTEDVVEAVKGSETEEVMFEKYLIKEEVVPVEPTTKTKKSKAEVEWRLFDALNKPNTPNFTRGKEIVLQNFLERYIPPYQAQFFINELSKKGKDKISKSEMIDIAKGLFIPEYQIFNAEQPLYANIGPKDTDRNTYFESHFGYPGAFNVVRKYRTPAKDLFYEPTELSQDEFNKIYGDTANYAEYLTNIKLLKELGITISKLPTFTKVYDPISKSLDENFLAYSPEFILERIIEETITDPLGITNFLYLEQRTKDILQGKRTVESFSKFEPKIGFEEREFVDAMDYESLGVLSKTDNERLNDLLLKKDLTEEEFAELSTLQEIVKQKLPEAKEKELEKILEEMKQAYKAADYLIQDMLRKPDKTPLDFKKSLEFIKSESPLAFDVIEKLKKDFVLTGSLGLSAFGTIYRDTMSPHDLDFIGDYTKFEKIYESKIIKGEAFHARTVDDVRTTHTYVLVPEGYKVGKILTGYVILDREGNIDTKLKPVIVDIFDESATTDEPILIDGYKIANPRSTFAAKIAFGRLKDIVDLYRYATTNQEYLDLLEEERLGTDKLIGSSHFNSMVGTFGWIRGDIKGDIARIFEVQSDLFRHGRKTVEFPDFKTSEIFLNAVGNYGFPKFALLAAIKKFQSQGIKKVRLPLTNAINEIEGFGEYDYKSVKAVREFYESTMRNLVSKLFKNNVKEITDERGLNWLEINIEEATPRIQFEKNKPLQGSIAARSLIKKVISGGQTGADLGGLEGAKDVGIPTGGTAPPRWISGGKSEKDLLMGYGLVEGEADPSIYVKRTMKNVDDSDGTLAVLWGRSVGTGKTIGYAQTKVWQYGKNETKDDGYKPVLVITHKDINKAAKELQDFIIRNKIKVLNVAGHRESSQPGIQKFTRELIKTALGVQQEQTPQQQAVPGDIKAQAEGQMTYSYGNQKREGVTALTTLEAIKRGERTATTRYASQGAIDYWSKLKVGDIIKWKSGNDFVFVRVTKPLTKLLDKNITAEEWSQKEGWSVEYFNKNVLPRIDEAYQIEYELVKPKAQSDIKEYTLSEFNEIMVKNGMVDETISEFGQWVIEQAQKLHPDLRVLGVNQDFQIQSGIAIGRNRAAYIPASLSSTKKPQIAINRQANDPKFYNSFIHESLHPFLLDKLKTNKTFRNEMEAIFKEVQFRMQTDAKAFYIANKADLDRALFDPELDDFGRLNEFIAHARSGTSVIHQWMRDNKLTNNSKQSILQRFLDIIKSLIARLNPNASPTFYQAMEMSFNKHFNSPSEFQYADLLKQSADEIRQNERIEAYDRLFELAEGFDSPRFIRAVGKLIADSEGRTENDYIRFVQGMTKEQFQNYLYKNPEWMKAAKLAYSKMDTDLTEGKYLDNIITQMYNHVINLEKTKTVRLVLNQITDIEGNTYTVPTIEELGDVYRTKDNNLQSTWRNKINLTSRIPELNEIFGTEFELVYLDDVKITYPDTNKKDEWKSIADIDYQLQNRNHYYAQMLERVGYIFPGTWSDKGTVVAFKPKDKIADLEGIFTAYREMYTQLLNNAVTAELAKPEPRITPEEAKQYVSATPTNQEIFRMIIEDLKLGAQVQNGQLQSVLFQNGIEDAVKIFKRATEVAPQQRAYQSPQIIQKILNSLKIKNHGIVKTEDGRLGVNTVIINGSIEKIKREDGTESSDWIETFNYKGRQITVDMADVLVNTLGTETTDGIEFYLEEGYGKVVRELFGTIKPGAFKNFILNSKNQSPFYVKGSQQLVKPDGILGSWMQENNIGLIIFSSAAKITSPSYPSITPQGIFNRSKIKQGESFVLPFDMIHRIKETNGVDDRAKGWAQSLLANLMADNNPYFFSKNFDKVVSDAIDALVDNLNVNLIKMDSAEILERLKLKALTSADLYERGLSQLVLDLAYTVSDKRLEELKTLPFASEALIKDYKLKKRLSNEQVAKEIGGLFHEPFFAEAVKSIVRSELQNVIYFKATGSWMLLRPDIGWLASENIDVLWNYLAEERKKEIDEEINVLRDELETLSATDKTDLIDKVKEEIQQKESEKHGNSKAFQESVWKKLENYIDLKSGRLKEGYGYVSEDIAKEFNISFGKASIAIQVPSSDIMAQVPYKAIPLPKSHTNAATVVLHSETVQSRIGRDFDADVMFALKDDKEFFPGNNYQDYYDSLVESHKLHQTNIPKVYSKVLGRPITEADLQSSDIQTEFMQRLYEDATDGQKIFNPLNSFNLLDKFTKPVGPIVTERKQFTLKSQTGFSTTVFINGKKYEISPANDGRYYLAARRKTEDAVDLPANTNSLFYNVTPDKDFDLMYNQNLSEQEVNTSQFYAKQNALRAFKAADEFLFGRAIKLSAQYNWEDMQLDRRLPEDLRYIQDQQRIIALIEQGRNEDLYNLFSVWFKEKYPDMKEINRNSQLGFARDYILNMKFKDLTKSPALEAVRKIPLQNIPSIGMTEDLYKIWQRDIAKEFILPEFENELSAANERRASEIEAFKSPYSKSLLRAFVLTEVNPALHMLKAKAIAAILPTDQNLRFIKDVEKAIEENRTYYIKTTKRAINDKVPVYSNNIYDVANKYVYPHLFRMLLQERSLIFNSSAPVTLQHKGKNIVLSKGQYNNLNIKIGNVSITGNRLLHDNTKWAENVRNEFFSPDGIFSDSNNRFKLSQLVSFGRNIKMEGRIDFVVDLLNKELPQFSERDKDMFWASLLGYPDVAVDGTLKAPLNFVPGVVSKKGEFADQKTLLVVASRVLDPSAKRFLHKYASVASKNYPGLTFDETARIESAIEGSVLQQKDKIWYDKSYDDEIKQTQIGFAEKYYSIFSIIHQKELIQDNFVEGKYFFPDLFSGIIGKVDRLTATRAISVHGTEVAAKKINLETIYYLKAKRLAKGLKSYGMIFNEVVDRVDRLLDSKIESLKNLPPSGRRKALFTKAHQIMETNPLNIKLKKGYGTSIYYELPDGRKYIEDVKNIPANLDKAEFVGDIEKMLKDHNVINFEDQIAHRIALELRSVYDIWNIRYAKHTLEYLRYLRNSLDPGFKDFSILNAKIKKWELNLERFRMREGRYFPHVFKDKDFEKALERDLEREILTEMPDISKADLEKEISVRKSKIRYDNYAGMIHSFEMRRERNLPGYITDSFLPHERHFLSFMDAVNTDITIAEMLAYDYEASKLGRTPKVKAQMKRWYELQTADKFTHSRLIKVSKIKPDDFISFYHNGEYISGQVDRIEDGYVYLKVDRGLIKRKAEQALEDWRKTAISIASNNNITNQTPISPKQKKVLQGLIDGKWSKVKVMPTTMVEANAEIIRGLEEMVSNSDNWARYKLDQLFIKQYDKSANVHQVNGVEKLILPDKLDLIARYANVFFATGFLGNPGGAVRNTLDAHYRLGQEIGWANYFGHGYYGLMKYADKKGLTNIVEKLPFWKNLPKMEQQGLKSLMWEAHKFNAQKVKLEDRSAFHALMEKMIMGERDVQNMIDEDTLKLVTLDAYQYIVENDALEKPIGMALMNEGRTPSSKVENILKIPLRLFFGRSEGSVRRAAAFMFAYKARVIDKITDRKVVMDVIENGVALTQSLYDPIHRRLGETNQKGKFLALFSQYQRFQWDAMRMELRQAKRLGQLRDVTSLDDLLFNVKAFFSRKMTVPDENGVIRTYKAGDSIDPAIPYMMAKRLLQDSFALTLMGAYPGLRLGSPLNIPFLLGINTLITLIMSGDLPDEWELKDFVFASLSIVFGFGKILPIQVVWSIADGSFRLTSYLPKLATTWWDLVSGMMDLFKGDKFDISNPYEKNKALQKSYYTLGKFSRFFTSIDFTPHTRTYYSYEKNRVVSKDPLFARPIEILKDPFFPVPVINFRRFSKTR